MGRNEPWNEERARAIIAEYTDKEGPLLPILHAMQETFGYIPEDAVPILAQALNVSRAEVHGAIAFYPDFRRERPGRHILKICHAEACQSMGVEALVAHAEKRLGVSCGHTTTDGAVTLEPVYCLGLCATAPSAMVDGRVVGRLDKAKFEAVLKEAIT